MLSALTSAYRTQRATAVPKPHRTPILTRIGRGLARITPTWATLRTLTLSTAGLGCLTAAAWTVHIAAGLAAAGVSLLLVEWLTGDRT